MVINLGMSNAHAQGPLEMPQAGDMLLKIQPQGLCMGPGLPGELRGRRLGQQHQPPVVAKILIAQFGMSIQPQAADHQALKMPGQKISEIEGTGLLLGQDGQVVW